MDEYTPRLNMKIWRTAGGRHTSDARHPLHFRARRAGRRSYRARNRTVSGRWGAERSRHANRWGEGSFSLPPSLQQRCCTQDGFRRRLGSGRGRVGTCVEGFQECTGDARRCAHVSAVGVRNEFKRGLASIGVGVGSGGCVRFEQERNRRAATSGWWRYTSVASNEHHLYCRIDVDVDQPDHPWGRSSADHSCLMI